MESLSLWRPNTCHPSHNNAQRSFAVSAAAAFPIHLLSFAAPSTVGAAAAVAFHVDHLSRYSTSAAAAAASTTSAAAAAAASSTRPAALLHSIPSRHTTVVFFHIYTYIYLFICSVRDADVVVLLHSLEKARLEDVYGRHGCRF